MDWKEKIIEGMKLLKEGCKENAEWIECFECPFHEYCVTLESYGIYHPLDWLRELKE